jgi:PAS domain S-box-containing protein
MNKEVLTAPALDALLQAPSLAIHAVDKQGRVIFWSPSASRMFGWTESEVLGRFLPIVPEAQRQEVYDRIQRDLKGESIAPLDVRRVRKDGSLLDISLWSTPMRDSQGEVIGILGLYADITARKRAEGALQQTAAELQQVLAAVSDYIWSGQIGPDGRFSYQYNSPSVERILGRPAEFFRAGPGRWLSILHPEDRPRAAQAADRLLTGPSAYEDEEYRIVLPNGAIRWVRNSVTISQSPDGLRCLNGVVTDITARKRAEEARQQATAELRRVLGAVSDCLYSGEFDSDGRFIYHYYSPAAERIFGRSPLFFLAGRERWLSAVHPEDRPRLAQAFAQLQTGAWAFAEEEYRIVLPDGTIRWVRDSVTLSQETGGHRFVNGVVSDITERKQAEEALRESEAELRQVLAAASDYFWSGEVDPEGRFRYLYYSPSVERITGRPAEFYMSGPERWMSTVHPEDRARLAEISERRLAGQPAPSEDEHRIVLPDGTIRWVCGKVTISPAANGCRRLDGVVSDITTRKQAEEALRDSEARFRGIFTAAAAGIVLVSPDGRFLHANPAFCEFLGYSEPELLGKTVQDITHPDDWGGSAMVIQEILEGEKSLIQRYEKRYLRKDGQTVWGEVSISLVRDAMGKASYTVAHVLDITERKKTE